MEDFDVSRVQCPFKGCDKPDTVRQGSWGFSSIDLACDNGHVFAVYEEEDTEPVAIMPCCGRTENQLHTAECPSALAQDAEDGGGSC